MKKSILFAIIAITLCSCSSSYKLSNTVWYNVTQGELAGEKGDIITSLYFMEDGQVRTNVCVKRDSTILVPITTVSYGEYTYKGNLRKGVKVNITTSDLYDNEKKQYGVITSKGMLLSETDSIARVYSKTNIILK